MYIQYNKTFLVKMIFLNCINSAKAFLDPFMVTKNSLKIYIKYILMQCGPQDLTVKQ